MKGHRKHRETGGVNEAREDEDTKPEARTDAKRIDAEAEEKKRGGRAKKRHGGKAEMKVDGEHAKRHAGRKPRKSGGAASDANPFTSARRGKDAPGRHLMKGEQGFGED